MLFKIRFTITLSCLIVLFVSEKSANGSSVYAIPDHWPDHLVNCKIQVYDILEGEQAGELEYQEYLLLSDRGATDVTIDEESNYLFVTYETFSGVPKIEIVDARTMLSEGKVPAEGANNLSGIVMRYDYSDPSGEPNAHVLTIDQQTNHLFVYNWDSEYKKLRLQKPDPNDPDNPNYPEDTNYYTLEPNDPGSTDAYGLAYDEITARLYVSYANDTVHIFDADTPYFDHLGSVDMENTAVGIDVDPNRHLYAGGYQGHPYLIKYDLHDPNATQIRDIGASVIGVAVDRNNPDFVYLTTYNHQVEAWDVSDPCSFYWEKIDYETKDVSGPAGICVANVDYVPPFSITKTDDIIDDCVPPRGDEEITYTITFEYHWTDSRDPLPDDDVVVIDELPDGVDFVSASADGIYDSDGHTVTWQVTPQDLDEPNYFEIVVQLNNTIIPGYSLENIVTVTGTISDNDYSASTTLYTDICCCSNYGDIIYVDESAAAGNDNGTSWYDAYLELTDALERAFPCDQVWVAQGTYKPAEAPSDPNTVYQSFALVETVAVFGGFPTGGGDWQDRNWINYETILSGHIDDGAYGYVYSVVTAENIKVAILGGFIITDGAIDGIFCDNASPSIQHNKIKENNWGIVVEGLLSQPVIKNNWIYENDAEGILLTDPNKNTWIRNNTIVDNGSGICLEYGDEPQISNCIIRRHPDANDVVNCTVKYSCLEDTSQIYDPLDPNSVERYNITTDPNFVDADNNNYHLNSVSLCIDTGDPNGWYSSERDIDGQYRVLLDNVDMGGDEYCDSSYESPADFNDDGIVNLDDYAELATAWLDEPSPSDPNSEYDLNSDEAIDLVDLFLFTNDWLWCSCDYFSSQPVMFGCPSGGGGMAETAPDEPLVYQPEYYEIEFSKEQIADFIETYAWSEKLFDDNDENVSMQAYITVDGVFYAINKDRPDGSHVEIGVDAAGKMLRHSTTDAQDRLTRFVAELLPDGGKVVFNVAYDNTGNKIVDEWIEYDSDGNMIEYWDLIAMEAEARQIAED